jgi:hypothetical protein
MRVPVYLEVGTGGSTRAWVLVLPGVAAAGRSPEAALAALPAVVAEEAARLARLGRPWAHGAEPLEFVETERVEVDLDLGRGASTALFKHDLRPTRPEDVAAARERFGLACREIEQAVRGLSPQAASGAAAGKAAPAAATAPATADDRLVAAAEGILWLVSRLGSRPPAPATGAPLERFLAAERIAVERLSNLLPGDIERHAVFAGEPWTTRKVLRRLALLAREEALLRTVEATRA